MERLIAIGLLLLQMPVATPQSGSSWNLPALSNQLKNPLASTADVLAHGKRLYAEHCQRCHGAEGRNDGPNSDRDEPTSDLTDPFRASINPDGVVFNKIWFGRFRPDMPASGQNQSNGRQARPGTLSGDDVWALVTYVQTLRQRAKN
jgi:mono/diheme cytochrome c family protein